MTPRLPDKQHFRREEVEIITRLEGRVLDYWEKEFQTIQPRTGSSGEKVYSREDVETILRVKEWLIQDRLGKEEVRRRLEVDADRNRVPDVENVQDGNKRKLLGEARSMLADILTILQKDDTK